MWIIPAIYFVTLCLACIFAWIIWLNIKLFLDHFIFRSSRRSTDRDVDLDFVAFLDSDRHDHR